jgi:hypothetical protein
VPAFRRSSIRPRDDAGRNLMSLPGSIASVLQWPHIGSLIPKGGNFGSGRHPHTDPMIVPLPWPQHTWTVWVNTMRLIGVVSSSGVATPT